MGSRSVAGLWEPWLSAARGIWSHLGVTVYPDHISSWGKCAQVQGLAGNLGGFRIHAVKRTLCPFVWCPYRLRDDARKDSAVLSYLQSENEYTKAVMADTEKLQVETNVVCPLHTCTVGCVSLCTFRCTFVSLQESLYKEMRARIKEDDRQVPSRYAPDNLCRSRIIFTLV